MLKIRHRKIFTFSERCRWTASIQVQSLSLVTSADSPTLNHSTMTLLPFPFQVKLFLITFCRHGNQLSETTTTKSIWNWNFCFRKSDDFALCYLFKTQTTFTYKYQQTSVLVYLSIIGTALEKFNDIVIIIFHFSKILHSGDDFRLYCVKENGVFGKSTTDFTRCFGRIIEVT